VGGRLPLALSAAGIGLSMITLSSIAFMFSCFKIKPAAATIITLTILFVDMILQGSRSSNPTKAGSSPGG
jgi:ABC-2 type transport system permease protein